jgi:hypothetical protein
VKDDLFYLVPLVVFYTLEIGKIGELVVGEGSRVDHEGKPTHEALSTVLDSISALMVVYLAALYIRRRRVYSVSTP